jgi:hypothetical protein
MSMPRVTPKQEKRLAYLCHELGEPYPSGDLSCAEASECITTLARQLDDRWTRRVAAQKAPA